MFNNLNQSHKKSLKNNNIPRIQDAKARTVIGGNGWGDIKGEMTLHQCRVSYCCNNKLPKLRQQKSIILQSGRQEYA